MGADDSQAGGKRARVTAADFMVRRQPDPIGRRRVSPMEPYLDDLLALRSAGYSDKQLLEFLSINGVVVRQQSLSSYLLRHGADRKVIRGRKGTGSQPPPTPSSPPQVPAAAIAEPPPASRPTTRAERERKASAYADATTTHPMIDKLQSSRGDQK